MKSAPDHYKLIHRMRELRKGWWVLVVTLLYMGISMRLFGTGCIFAGMTGIPCPGCGITRSIMALLRLDIASSFFYYPVLIPCGVGLAAYFNAWVRNGTGSKRWNRFLGGMGIVIVVVYVVRMFFLFPDTPPLDFNHRAMLPQVVGWILDSFLL